MPTPTTIDDGIWVVEDLLTSEECDRWIDLGEVHGFSFAPVTTSAGMVERPDVRNNDRAMADLPLEANQLWERLKPFVNPDEVYGWAPYGLNERLRWYRYVPGQRFRPHTDGAFLRNANDRSLFSVLFYLNDNMEGGATQFLDRSHQVLHRVVPKKGQVLVFLHPLYHEGEEVRRGEKYVLRSDLMFRRTAG